ncbi:calcium-binding protein [Catellatospora sp. TT07R-123]|uniref:EF-hand domain-containing protein n=1 Tax=Catellatospora sp. TT07R-123 TaxID=2733863 RepID=UPI001B04F107|nr:EF-hand domain-containing protein [Catellatospora sp. TT07R-123]GHJ43041.1 calcium-binding protein [Catellatospora sp. TT07R-123]
MDIEISDRIRLRFDLFDADGNGVLEPEDFVAVADRIIQAVGAAPTDPKARALRAAHDQYWQSLRSASAAERVDLPAYAAIVSADGWFDQYGLAYAEALADICDRDDDGLISLTEFQPVMEAAGFAPGKVRALFASFDRDGSGSIDRGEWIAGIGEFYDPTVSDAVTGVLAGA